MNVVQKKKAFIICALACCIALITVIITINTKSEEQSKVVYEYDILQNVLSSADSSLNNEYDNLKLPDKVYPSTPNKLYECYEDDSVRYDSSKAINEAVGLFGTITETQLSEINFYSENEEYFLNIDPDQNPQKWMGVYMPQGKCDISTINAALRRNNAGIIRGYYYIKRGDTLNDEYDINGEKVKISDAVEYCKSYLKKIDFYKYIDSRIVLEPSLVVVKQTKGPYDYAADPNQPTDDTNYINVFFDIIYDGVPLCDTGTMNSNGEYFNDATFCMMLDEKDHIGCIRNIGNPTVQSSKELEDKFITLNSCLNVVSDYLASESDYTVTEIGIRYCTLRTTKSTQRTRKPYWRIILTEKIGSDLHARDVRATYVDMVSGDIYVYDDSRGEMLGVMKASESEYLDPQNK